MALTVEGNRNEAIKYFVLGLIEVALTAGAACVATEAWAFELHNAEERLFGPIPDEYNNYVAVGSLALAGITAYLANRSFISADKAYGRWIGRGVPRPIKFAPFPAPRE